MISRIAQLCILYEDLRLETQALFDFAQKLTEANLVDNPYEVIYYIRRSTTTLVEFRGALNQLCSDKEFKGRLRSVAKKHAKAITKANMYFEKHFKRIKNLRDNFGAHVQFAFVQHATANFDPKAEGCIKWDPAHRYLALNVDLAADILVAGLGCALHPKEQIPKEQRDESTLQEFRLAIHIIGESYQKAVEATYALISQFLWPGLQESASEP